MVVPRIAARFGRCFSCHGRGHWSHTCHRLPGFLWSPFTPLSKKIACCQKLIRTSFNYFWRGFPGWLEVCHFWQRRPVKEEPSDPPVLLRSCRWETPVAPQAAPKASPPMPNDIMCLDYDAIGPLGPSFDRFVSQILG